MTVCNRDGILRTMKSLKKVEKKNVVEKGLVIKETGAILRAKAVLMKCDKYCIVL